MSYKIYRSHELIDAVCFVDPSVIIYHSKTSPLLQSILILSRDLL